MTPPHTVPKTALPADQLEAILEIARQFDVAVLWLFGSALEDPENARDIDLAVEGCPPEKFFQFYGELIDALPKSVDLVDMSLDPPIAVIVRDEGIRIYER